MKRAAVRRVARWRARYVPLWLSAILLAAKTLREEVRP